MGHAGLGWVIQGWGGSYRGGLWWIIQGWGGSYMCCGGVWKISLNNLICHKSGILSFLLTNYCQMLSG